MSEPEYTEFEEGERRALLHVRSFITKHGTKEVDAYCAQLLHDLMMDARHREDALRAAAARATGELQLRPGGLNYASLDERGRER